MTEVRYLTPPQLAERYGVKPAKVIGWIRRGEIRALDMSDRPGLGRPRYRISQAAIEQFERRRAATADATPIGRRANGKARRFF